MTVYEVVKTFSHIFSPMLKVRFLSWLISSVKTSKPIQTLCSSRHSFNSSSDFRKSDDIENNLWSVSVSQALRVFKSISRSKCKKDNCSCKTYEKELSSLIHRNKPYRSYLSLTDWPLIMVPVFCHMALPLTSCSSVLHILLRQLTLSSISCLWFGSRWRSCFA